MKIDKKLMALLLAVMMIVAMCGCGSSGSGQTEETTTEATTTEATEAVDLPEGYEGRWVDKNGQKATMAIYTSDGYYHIDIILPTGSKKEDAWNMDSSYDKSSGKLVYKNCIYTHNTYSGDVGSTCDKVYSDGTGSLSYSNGVITWHDDKDDAGKNYEFVINEE